MTRRPDRAPRTPIPAATRVAVAAACAAALVAAALLAHAGPDVTPARAAASNPRTSVVEIFEVFT